MTAFLNAGCSVNTELLGSETQSSTTPNTTEYLVQFGVTGGLFMMGGADSDSDGNLYINGIASGDYGATTQIGTYDALIAKYSSAGVLEWAAREGTAAGMVVGGRIRYAGGYVYTTGYTLNSIAGETLNGNTDLFVAKYDASTGNRIWLKLLGTATYAANGTDLRVDSNGNVFVCGHTNAPLGGQSLNGFVDAFIAKYDNNGNRLWVRQVGEALRTLNGNALGLDGSGNIYLGGVFSGTYDGHTAAGNIDGLLIKFNSAGTKQWSSTLGSTPGAVVGVLDMAIDSSGNAYLGGYTDRDIDGNTHVGNKDQMLAKFDSNGVRQWTKLYSGPAGSYQQTMSVKLDSNNHVITGGGDNFNDGGTYGWTILRWDISTGALVDALHDTATGGGAMVSDMHISSDGYVEAVGMVWGSLTGYTVSGALDGFVMRKKLN
ncbi:SBBP repeat-containing protein [Bdellovibrio sp. HCB337]|uniref:SBBP repeat-containing protein n=1 Tax=Bdellovibrio sp. HCB337 TaxID=3394358 RepID=UPI0039A401BC